MADQGTGLCQVGDTAASGIPGRRGHWCDFPLRGLQSRRCGLDSQGFTVRKSRLKERPEQHVHSSRQQAASISSDGTDLTGTTGPWSLVLTALFLCLPCLSPVLFHWRKARNTVFKSTKKQAALKNVDFGIFHTAHIDPGLLCGGLSRPPWWRPSPVHWSPPVFSSFRVPSLNVPGTYPSRAPNTCPGMDSPDHCMAHLVTHRPPTVDVLQGLLPTPPPDLSQPPCRITAPLFPSLALFSAPAISI